MRAALLASTTILAWAAPLNAETPISAKRTTGARTSTIANGAADSIKITSTGSVEITAGSAVVMDSNHAITNEGKVLVSNANGGAGIVANAGTTGDIVVATGAVITVDETYTPSDIDNDGDLDGPFATGTNRFGIRTLGAHAGNLVQNGTVTVEGNDSAGIWLGGPFTGTFSHDGITRITGDRVVGVRADAVTGNVRLAGTVSATGLDAVGARFSGDIAGALVVQGAISSTGYRFTTSPADPSKLDADDKLQGGSALVVEGGVSGGIVLAVPPKDANASDNDEDRDGIEDAKEGSASVVTFGAAPAMIIGSASQAIAIGPISGAGTGFGLQIDGAVAGNGVYSGIEGNGLLIGGRGGAVSIAGGMGVAGSVSVTARDASATAVRIGTLATVPEIRISGTVSAAGGAAAGNISTAVQIDSGANVGTVRNSGTIKAVAGGTAATAIALIDRTGGVTLVENSGIISATGAATGTDRNVAIDLSANGSGVTLRNVAVANGITAPSIIGDIRLGNGNDLIDVARGSISGTTSLGSGNDTMQLAGDATVAGRVAYGAGNDALLLGGNAVFSAVADFAGGGMDTMTLTGSARFAGSLLNAQTLAVTVQGGTLDLAVPSALGSLAIGTGGTLLATLDKDAGQGTAITVAGTASFASGASLQLKLADLANAEGRYVLVNAATLQGLAGITTKTDLLPFLYKVALATNAPANQLAIDIARKSASELGLNGSQTTAYSAVYAAFATDQEIADVFLNIREGALFRQTFQQMLPEHAGGTFRAISLGSRTMARQVSDPAGPIALTDNFRIGLSAGVWGLSKAQGTTHAFNTNGLGFGATAELETGFGSVGASLSWQWNENKNGSDDNTVISNSYVLGGHWRGKWSGFGAYARGAIGRVSFDSQRFFGGATAAKAIERTTAGQWNGTLTSLAAGASLEGGGHTFFFRPAVQIDYVRLSENAHTETGGGAGLNLTIDRRTSSELAAEGGLTLGADISGMSQRDRNWLRIEVEGGWREILDGKLGTTTARFGNGAPFTLSPEGNSGGWYGRARALGGTGDFQIGGELGAEDTNGRLGLSLRGTLRMPF